MYLLYNNYDSKSSKKIFIIKGNNMNTYSEFIEGLNEMSLPELKEMRQIIKNIISEKRRANILKNFQESEIELNSGNLIFSSDINALMEQFS